MINPDATRVPDISSFFVQLLNEAWHRALNGFWFDHPDPTRSDVNPLSADQSREITANMRLKDQFAKLQNLFHGTIRVDEHGYLLADDGRTVLDPPRRAAEVYKLSGGLGMDEISHYVTERPDPDVIYRRCDNPWEPDEEREEMATWVGPADMDNWRVWPVIRIRSMDERPYSDITVTVGDPGYLEHLTAGMRWSSTAHGYFLAF